MVDGRQPGDRTHAPIDLERLRLDRTPRRVRDGPGRPVSCRGRPANHTSEDTCGGDRIQITVALILLWTGTQASIIEYASVGLAIFSMLAMSSIYVLRWRRPDLPRPFRTPGYPLTPAIYLLLTGVLTVAMFKNRPTVSSYALASILAGIPFYYIWQGKAPSLDALRRISKLRKRGSEKSE